LAHINTAYRIVSCTDCKSAQ